MTGRQRGSQSQGKKSRRLVKNRIMIGDSKLAGTVKPEMRGPGADIRPLTLLIAVIKSAATLLLTIVQVESKNELTVVITTKKSVLKNHALLKFMVAVKKHLKHPTGLIK